MFIAAQSSQKVQITRCPSADEWIHKMWPVRIMEYFSAPKSCPHLPLHCAHSTWDLSSPGGVRGDWTLTPPQWKWESATGLPRKPRGVKFWFTLYTMNELENKLDSRTDIITWFRLHGELIRTGRLEGSQGQEEGRMGSYFLTGAVSVWGWWKFCQQMVVIVAQCCRCNWWYWILHFQVV